MNTQEFNNLIGGIKNDTDIKGSAAILDSNGHSIVYHVDRTKDFVSSMEINLIGIYEQAENQEARITEFQKKILSEILAHKINYV